MPARQQSQQEIPVGVFFCGHCASALPLYVARVHARYCEDERKKSLAILKNPTLRGDLIKRVGERQVSVMAEILGMFVLR